MKYLKLITYGVHNRRKTRNVVAWERNNYMVDRYLSLLLGTIVSDNYMVSGNILTNGMDLPTCFLPSNQCLQKNASFIYGK